MGKRKALQVHKELFDIKRIEANEFTLRILEVIKNRWPTNPLEVAETLGDSGNIKALSARYLYHFRKLKEMNLIDMKKLGNSYIAWPIEVEKLRMVHDFLKGL